MNYVVWTNAERTNDKEDPEEKKGKSTAQTQLSEERKTENTFHFYSEVGCWRVSKHEHT